MTARGHKHPRRKALGVDHIAGGRSLGKDRQWPPLHPQQPLPGRARPWLGTQEHLDNESSVETVGLPLEGASNTRVFTLEFNDRMTKMLQRPLPRVEVGLGPSESPHESGSLTLGAQIYFSNASRSVPRAKQGARQRTARVTNV